MIYFSIKLPAILFKVPFMIINKFENVDTFNGLFSIDNYILNWGNIFFVEWK